MQLCKCLNENTKGVTLRVRLLLIYLLSAVVLMLNAVPRNVLGELFTEECSSCGGDYSSARSALIQLADQNSNFIPVIWQTTTPMSPGVTERINTYSVSQVPHAWFNGIMDYQGEDFVADNYSSIYSQLHNLQSSISIEMDLEIHNDTLKAVAHIALENDIATGNSLYFLLTNRDNSNYSSLVIQNSGSIQFNLATSGQSQDYTYDFSMVPEVDINDYRAVVFIQDNTTNEILQSEQTIVTDLRADFNVVSQVGPASFLASFENLSQPSERITQWMWDFQNDGTIDSYDENPRFLFDTPEVYDVALYISDGTDTVSIVKQRAVYVTDASNVGGNVTGVWRSEYSPYVITLDTVVPDYGELTIEPGVEVRFNTGKKMTVFGKLDVNGSDDNPVLMHSETTWKGLKLVNSNYNNLIRNLEVRNATLSGIYLTTSNAEIDGVWVHNNNTGLLAGGIEIFNSDSVSIKNSFINSNYSEDNAGGLGVRSSNVTLENTVIVNNTGSTAGSISVAGDSVFTAVNNTISHNFGLNNVSVLFDADNITFKNNIVFSASDIQINGSNVDITYSNISGFSGGTGNIDTDPMFVSPSSGHGSDSYETDSEWHLTASSPSIDAGDPGTEYNDIENPENPSYALFPAMGTIRNDMGAYGGRGNNTHVTAIDDEEKINNPSHSLISNYPNPFNPKTTIQVSLSRKDAENQVNISVYNLKGQKVTTLYNDIPKQEKYNIVWNGTNSSGLNVASGVYFVKLTTKTEHSMRKIVLLK